MWKGGYMRNCLKKRGQDWRGSNCTFGSKYLKLDCMVEKPGDLISEVIFKILMKLDILHLLLFRSVLIKVQL